jgi:ABC-type multidrug transport system ATPase subunit
VQHARKNQEARFRTQEERALIRTKNLTKVFGKFTAVNDVSLDIRRGEVYGFLGPNGSGKTTTMMMLLGLLQPTSGEILLFGEKLTSSQLDLRKRVGVVPEKHPRGMWKWMTAKEYLKYFADFFCVKEPAKRIAHLLDRVDLSDCTNDKIHTFSRGMLQKLSISRALLHDPDFLILDEPHAGLDPLGLKKIRDLIVSENREGRTILVSSHLLSEVEKICHRVGIIDKGALLAEDTMDNLIAKFSNDREIVVELERIPESLVEEIKRLEFVHNAFVEGTHIIIKVPKTGDFRKQVSEFFIRKELIPLAIQEKSFSLEDAFATITRENVGMLAGIGGKS